MYHIVIHCHPLWVMGQKVKIDNTEEYEALLEQARHDAIRLQGHQEQNLTNRKKAQRRQIRREEEDIMYQYLSAEYCPF